MKKPEPKDTLATLLKIAASWPGSWTVDDILKQWPGWKPALSTLRNACTKAVKLGEIVLTAKGKSGQKARYIRKMVPSFPTP